MWIIVTIFEQLYLCLRVCSQTNTKSFFSTSDVCWNKAFLNCLQFPFISCVAFVSKFSITKNKKQKKMSNKNSNSSFYCRVCEQPRFFSFGFLNPDLGDFWTHKTAANSKNEPIMENSLLLWERGSKTYSNFFENLFSQTWISPGTFLSFFVHGSQAARTNFDFFLIFDHKKFQLILMVLRFMVCWNMNRKLLRRFRNNLVAFVWKFWYVYLKF